MCNLIPKETPSIELAIPHATCRSVGMEFRAVAGQEAEAAVQRVDLTELMDKYLHTFADTEGKCPGCGYQLAGFLGSFIWGLVSGEGHCASCKWPCRGVHSPKYDDGVSIFQRPFSLVLPYHPDFVVPADEALVEKVAAARRMPYSEYCTTCGVEFSEERARGTRDFVTCVVCDLVLSQGGM